MILGKGTPDRRVISPLRLIAGVFLCGLAVIFGVSAARATTQNDSAPSGPVATLRVETNLVQIPVLVLDKFRERLHSPVAENRFDIRLGDGPWVRPKYVRLEGEDAIDLAIVIDPRGPQIDLLPKLSKSIAGLSVSSLSSRDRVSIYMMGCSVMHVAKNIPIDPAALRNATETVLKNWKNHAGEANEARCKPGTQLWDMLAYVARAISDEPGRRTILAITNGDDKKSQHTPDDLIALARSEGVSIFALDATIATPVGSLGQSAGEEPLSVISESSGGVTLNLAGHSVDKELKRFVQMLRDRYIVEFPRPSVAKAGKVDFDVRIADSEFFIRAASKGVPLPNPPEVGNDTITVANVEQGPAVISNSPRVPAAISEESSPEASQPQAAGQRQAASGIAPSIAVPNPEQPDAVAPAVAQQPSPGMVTPTSPPAQPALPPARTTPPPSSNLVLRVQVPLVVLDVVVDDAAGHPVHGLTAADFTILDGGQKMTPQSFEEHSSDQAALPSPPRKLNLGPNTFTNFSSTPGNGPHNILLLDTLNTPMAAQAIVRQQILEYLKKLPAGMHIAVFGLSTHLYMLQGFTSDPALLQAALNPKKYLLKDPSQLDEANSVRKILDAGSPNHGAAHVKEFLAPIATFEDTVRVKDTLAAMNQLGRYLSGMPGRKNLIWFSGSFPINIMPDQNIGSRDPVNHWVAMADFSDEVKVTTDLLTKAEVAVYPVDGRGLFDNPRKSDMNPNSEFLTEKFAEQATMNQMANQTGGKAFYNTNGLAEAVQEAIGDGSNYYTISYAPANEKRDGSYRSVRVSLDQPSVHLFYRHGYFADSPAKAGPTPPSAFDIAMGHGAPPSTQLVFNVHVTPSSAAAKPGDPQIIGSLSRSLEGRHLVRYDFLYDFTGDQITLADNANGAKSGSVEFILAAYDADGKLLNMVGQTSRFTVTPDNVAGFMKRKIEMPIQFDLPAGDVFVRVGLKDVPSEKTGTLEIAEDVARK